MSQITGFAVVPKGALSSFASAVTFTATTTKTVLESVHAARPTIPAKLLQNTTIAYEQAAKQSANHGIVLASLTQMRPVVGLFLEGFIVSGGFYKLCERLAKLAPPSGENAKYWRDKVKNTCTWLKRLVSSDERLREELKRAHEEVVAAKEEARRARVVERNTTEEECKFAMEVVEVEDKAKSSQHDLDRSPEELRRQIHPPEQRLSQTQNASSNAQLEAEFEELRRHADHLKECLQDQEITYENKLAVGESRVNEANATLRLSVNELQEVSILAEHQRVQLETKDMDLKKTQELIASLQQGLSDREDAAISLAKRADELQAQLNERNNDLQQVHTYAEKLQERIDEQNEVLTQAQAHAQAQQEEIDTAKSLEEELEQHIADYKQDLEEEVQKREAAEKQLWLIKTPQKQKSSIHADVRALASPLEARFLSGIPSSQPSVRHNQGRASPAPMPTSGAKRIVHADIEHMSEFSRSSTPSKHASKKRRLSSESEVEFDSPTKFASSPPQPAVPVPQAIVEDDAMNIAPPLQQPVLKPKLDFFTIPNLGPTTAVTIPATPSHTTRHCRAVLPIESPSRKSTRSTAKPLSYRESALAARLVSPEKIAEEAKDEDDMLENVVSPLKKSTGKAGLGGVKEKGRKGSESVLGSPSKKTALKGVKDSGVKKR